MVVPYTATNPRVILTATDSVPVLRNALANGKRRASVALYGRLFQCVGHGGGLKDGVKIGIKYLFY